MRRLFYALTGRPGIGKTTAIKEVVSNLQKQGLSVGGMYTLEIRKGAGRVGFEIIDITFGRRGVLAMAGSGAGPRVGRYVVDIASLESIGVEAVFSSLRERDVTILDEVGPMELKSNRFRECVEALLASDKPAIVTVHVKADDPLVRKVKTAAGENLIVLTEENRSQIPRVIADRIAGELLGHA